MLNNEFFAKEAMWPAFSSGKKVYCPNDNKRKIMLSVWFSMVVKFGQ